MNEFNKWIPIHKQKEILGSIVPLNSASVSSPSKRTEELKEWFTNAGVLISSYALMRTLLTGKETESSSNDQTDYNELTPVENSCNELAKEAFITPGPALIICDEGHYVNIEIIVISLLFINYYFFLAQESKSNTVIISSTNIHSF